MAPPGNQAANRENKLQPIATEGPGLLDQKLSIRGVEFSRIMQECARNCARDEGRPLEVALQEEASNPLKLRW